MLFNIVIISVAICIILLILISLYINIKNVRKINHIQSKRVNQRYNLYENIPHNLLKPRSFLLMKNEGNDLCNSENQPTKYVIYYDCSFILK